MIYGFKKISCKIHQTTTTTIITFKSFDNINGFTIPIQKIKVSNSFINFRIFAELLGKYDRNMVPKMKGVDVDVELLIQRVSNQTIKVF